MLKLSFWTRALIIDDETCFIDQAFFQQCYNLILRTMPLSRHAETAFIDTNMTKYLSEKAHNKIRKGSEASGVTIIL
jgi:hypothetical protein